MASQSPTSTPTMRAIRTWGGEAVAYLDNANDGSWYGWFERGVIWNTNGHAECALRQALTVAPFAEPAKFAVICGAPNRALRTVGRPTYVNTFELVTATLS